MNEQIPKHIAIIMDGNGRWARNKGFPRIEGHKIGAEVAKKILLQSINKGVKYLTLYAFSVENWKRSENEVAALIKLMEFYLSKEKKELSKAGVRFKAIGEISKFPKHLQQSIIKLEESTQENNKLTLCLAINYGSRQEIIEAVKKISEQILAGKFNISDIKEQVFEDYLYTANIPSPDLLIRTSGEQRLSNFLLWQAAYTELYFSDKYWPEFSEEDFNLAIINYQKRERRYGAAN